MTDDQLRAAIVSKIDEGTAVIREFIKRSDQAGVADYLAILVAESHSQDLDVCLKATLAFVGLCHGYLSVIDEAKDHEKEIDHE